MRVVRLARCFDSKNDSLETTITETTTSFTCLPKVPFLSIKVVRRAIWRGDHTIVHNFIPIFASDDTKQDGNGVRRRMEIGVPIDVFPVLDGADEVIMLYL